MKGFLVSIFLIIAAMFLVYYYVWDYVYSKNLRFRINGESKTMKRLIDLLSPKENTPKYKKIADRIFYLDSEWTVRDFYRAKIIFTLFFSFCVASIMATNVLEARENVFRNRMPATGAEVIVSVDKPLYKHLTKGITFSPDNKEQDYSTLRVNIFDLEGNDLLKELPTTDIYQILLNLNKELDDTFGFSTIFLFLLAISIGYQIINIFVLTMFNIVKSSMDVEYDDLETLILLKISIPFRVENLLQDLFDSSRSFKELFKEFLSLYTKDSVLAYELVFARGEFPRQFIDLIRYIYQADTTGSHSVIPIIEANKEITMDTISDKYKDKMATRKAILLLFAVACFMLTMVLIFYPFISMLDLSNLSNLQ